MVEVILFVGNLSTQANRPFLERLFSAYGQVVRTEIFGEGSEQYAEVTFSEIDDADTAIGALHCRYCCGRNVPLIVLYSRNSHYVSEYGRLVGKEFSKCLNNKVVPTPVPLTSFDPAYSRSSVILPPPGTAPSALSSVNYVL